MEIMSSVSEGLEIFCLVDGVKGVFAGRDGEHAKGGGETDELV
jgi:hypothetical protein